MQYISNVTTDEERAFYGLKDAVLESCAFAGEKDGESALKEARNIEVINCSFSLRYPLWHTENYKLLNAETDENTRAALWYAKNGENKNCRLFGIKCLRECERTNIFSCKIKSPEFGWKCKDTGVYDCEIESEYLFLDSAGIEFYDSRLKGKYSFQYTENLKVKNAYLDTKDAFWHSKNAVIENSVIKGKYLGWYSENLTFINCKIIGTQPLCYCKGLRLIDCTMEDTDLAFEYSDVKADIKGNILSVKNPKSGYIKAENIGEIINENSLFDIRCEIETDK